MKLIALTLFCISLLANANVEAPRYYDLSDMARAEVSKDLNKAKGLAQELLDLSETQPRDWNFGNAVHYGNMVLGQVALREGNLLVAENYLLKSGAIVGSPQLNTFGPNMTLAKELIEAKRPDAVLQYFELCAQFWAMSRGRLAIWAKEVENGEMPDFKANLLY